MQCLRYLGGNNVLHPRLLPILHPKYRLLHGAILLRPYQEQCLDACVDALQAGASRIGVSLPTGSGKTTVFISLLSRIPAPPTVESATRSLIIVNSIELARQSAEQVARLFPQWSVEIEQGNKHQASGFADVTVATYQTLLRPKRLAKFDPRNLKAVIIDEAHHAAAPSYRSLLSRFHAAIQHPDADSQPPAPGHTIPVIGFSATFSRHDGLALGSVFEQIVYHRDFLEMMKENWLCDIRFTSVRVELDLTSVALNSKSGDYNAASLASIVNTESMNELVVRTWLDRAANRKSTLIFCVNIAHVVALTQTFRTFGVDARYVHAQTSPAERRALVAGFKSGEFPVLINCAVLTEGADIPNIDCVILAKPTRSRNLFAQMIGRGMRLSPSTGKEDCRIIDFVDSTERSGGAMSVPSLFGLDPLAVEIEDEDIRSLEEKARGASPTSAAPRIEISSSKSVTYTDYEDPFSWVEENSGAPHVNKMSQYAWVGCGSNTYVLECLGKGFIRIESTDESRGPFLFLANYTPSAYDAWQAKSSPYFRSRKIATTRSLEEAIRASDTYVKRLVLPGNMWKGILRSAKWRRFPASEQQKKWIAKRMKQGKSEEPEGKTKLETLTKGMAANTITRLKHGAQVSTTCLMEKKRHSKEG
ncbi:P-loop containing nucleoside triphosphate hydrolase protein [Pluteus cervinus]|uniref:P-loop containing nucleoside triphosphate hydrolase protein n=1 Tax=Pluteus cervinus TaxID=181527 RepID=A0ACD3BGI1_9AGAR|nr:P-loop containing nucleoside triphosphate hydrolase protein [Pluteus cervinus]